MVRRRTVVWSAILNIPKKKREVKKKKKTNRKIVFTILHVIVPRLISSGYPIFKIIRCYSLKKKKKKKISFPFDIIEDRPPHTYLAPKLQEILTIIRIAIE